MIGKFRGTITNRLHTKINNIVKSGPINPTKEGEIGEAIVGQAIYYFLLELGFMNLGRNQAGHFHIDRWFLSNSRNKNGIDLLFELHSRYNYTYYFLIEVKNLSGTYLLYDDTFEEIVMRRFEPFKTTSHCCRIVTLHKDMIRGMEKRACNGGLETIRLFNKITDGSSEVQDIEESFSLVMSDFYDILIRWLGNQLPYSPLFFTPKFASKEQELKYYISKGLPTSVLAEYYDTPRQNIYNLRGELIDEGIPVISGRSHEGKIVSGLFKV